jgi:hypothetical protein
MKKKSATRKVLSGAERDALDLEIINRHAEELSREALDVLKYQTLPWEIPKSLPSRASRRTRRPR